MTTAPARATDQRPIVVAGAGIGGLTAALALAATGFSVVVCERTETLSVVGAGIQIAPNAGRILAGLGLEPAMAAAAIEPPAIAIANGVSGRHLTTIPADAFRERYAFPYRVIHRADLQALLVEAVARTPTIALHLGTTVEVAEARADGIDIRIGRAGGGETIEAAALIAADGVRSWLRELVVAGARAASAGRTAWRAVVPADAVHGPAATGNVGLWLGPDAHLVHYPVTQGRAVNIVAIIEEPWDEPGWDAPGWKGRPPRPTRPSR